MFCCVFKTFYGMFCWNILCAALFCQFSCLLSFVLLCSVLLRFVFSVMSCYVMSCHVVLCSDQGMFCFVLVCCVILGFVMLGQVNCVMYGSVL